MSTSGCLTIALSKSESPSAPWCARSPANATRPSVECLMGPLLRQAPVRGENLPKDFALHAVRQTSAGLRQEPGSLPVDFRPARCLDRIGQTASQSLELGAERRLRQEPRDGRIRSSQISGRWRLNTHLASTIRLVRPIPALEFQRRTIRGKRALASRPSRSIELRMYSREALRNDGKSQAWILPLLCAAATSRRRRWRWLKRTVR